jgi:dihydrofolate reductase
VDHRSRTSGQWQSQLRFLSSQRRTVTLDGFIAAPDGSYDFLQPFDSIDYGFNRFLGSLGTTIQGRTTYDQVHALPAWPYGTIPSYVVTSREAPGEHPPPP